MKQQHEIKTVVGTQRKVRNVIDALVASHKPVFDVSTKRVGLFMYVAVIKTDKALIPKHR